MTAARSEAADEGLSLSVKTASQQDYAQTQRGKPQKHQ